MEWYFFAIASAILVSVAAILEKKTLLKENALEFSTCLGLFNVIVSIPILLFVSWNVSFNILAMIYIVSVFGAVAFYLVAKSLRHMEISVQSPLLNFEPVILLIFSTILLGEKISSLQLIGIFTIVAGGYLLELPKNFNFEKPLELFLRSKSIHLIFIALVLYAFSSIGDKIVLSYVEPLKYILIVQVFLAINYLIMISIFQEGLKSIRHGIKRAWKSIFAMALITTSYRILQAQAIAMTLVSLVIPIKRLSTAIVTFVGGEFFHERRVIFRSLVALLMILGATLIILG